MQLTIDQAETEQVLLIYYRVARDPISDSQLSTPLSVPRQGRSPGKYPNKKRTAKRDVTRELTWTKSDRSERILDKIRYESHCVPSRKHSL